MSKIAEYVKSLQALPLNTRTRILWVVTILSAAVLVSVWVLTIKAEFKDSNAVTETAQESRAGHSTVERIELDQNSLKLFFKVSNQTNDILTFSTAENITLSIDGQTLKPTKIVDRQGRAFVQKILSNTENFGILLFPATDADEGTIIFDDLYFENHPETIFKETIELDFSKLKKSQELRS